MISSTYEDFAACWCLPLDTAALCRRRDTSRCGTGWELASTSDEYSATFGGEAFCACELVFGRSIGLGERHGRKYANSGKGDEVEKLHG